MSKHLFRRTKKVKPRDTPYQLGPPKVGEKENSLSKCIWRSIERGFNGGLCSFCRSQVSQKEKKKSGLSCSPRGRGDDKI